MSKYDLHGLLIRIGLCDQLPNLAGVVDVFCTGLATGVAAAVFAGATFVAGAAAFFTAVFVASVWRGTSLVADRCKHPVTGATTSKAHPRRYFVR